MWYVVQTTSGQEDTAVEKCRKAIPTAIATKIFSPSYECMRRYLGAWHIKIQKLFPGYVFIESEDAKELEKCLENISGVVTPVVIGGGFYPIREDEQELLSEMFDPVYCIRYSLGYIVDEKLIVEEGPLLGKAEYVKKIDRHKRIAFMLIHLFGEEKRIEVGLKVPARLTGEEYREMKGMA